MELASNMAVVISPSSFLANMLRTWLPKPPNLHVVPNAVRVRESGPATDYFLYAGRLSHEKGVTTLIEAAAEANLPVVIAGDGPIRAQLEERATGTVTFLGHVDGKTIDRYLEGAIASVVPSQWYENAPLAVLEPMACGRPVVASNVGGIPEMVRDHIDGLLVEPGDAHALAEALAHLASNPQLAAEMGARAREQVAQRFNPERHVDLLTRAYSEAIGRRPVL